MAIVPAENNYQVSFKNKRVSTLTELNMQIKFNLPIPADSVVRIRLPDEIAISDISGTQTFINTISNGRKFLKFEQTGQQVVITDAVTSYQDSGQLLNLIFSKV